VPRVSKTKLYAQQPDPLEARPEEVEEYVKAIQGLGPADAELAQREAWTQIRLAGERAARDRVAALDALNRMFRLGTPPDPSIDGPCDGILVTTSIAGVVDPVLRRVKSGFMPWLGKRFDSSAQTGDNLLTKTTGTRLTGKAMFPRYELEDADDDKYAAFRFRTYVAPGKLDPDREALKIDYDSEENPSFLIRDILDELVQIVPGAHLGKILLRRGEPETPKWQLLGYFALQPAGVPEPGAEAEAEEAGEREPAASTA
jgi:hypothetical protein